MLAAFVMSVCLVLPAHAGVIDGFRAPACERCAGNRGLELATRSGDVITAGLDGEVSFAGLVGGRLYVVLRATTDPRVRVTYGGLATTAVRTGDVVATGNELGTADSSLFVGVRVGERHVDPTRYVAPVTTGSRPDGSASAGAPPRFRITLGRLGTRSADRAAACVAPPSPR